MTWINTTIKREYIDQILAGTKKIEYKVASPFWEKRLSVFVGPVPEKPEGIIFLCGREVFRFKVEGVRRCGSRNAQLIVDTWTNEWFEIRIGERIE